VRAGSSISVRAFAKMGSGLSIKGAINAASKMIHKKTEIKLISSS
jgi:hypothetical protein